MNSEQKRNVKIGVFALVAFAILYVGLNYLKGKNLFLSGATLKAYYANVDGLTDSSPVMYCGLKVGSVKDIDIDQSAIGTNKLFAVTFSLEKSIDVPVDSRAVIISTDLLGGKGIELILGKSTQMASSGDSISSAVKGGLLDELVPVKDDATALMRSADNVMRSIDTILADQNRAYIDDAIQRMAIAMENIEKMSRNLAAMTSAQGSVNATLSSADKFMTALSNQNGRIDTLMYNMAAISSELAHAGLGGTVEHLDTLISATSSLLSANGNIARVANDTRLYDNILTITENLNRLLVDIRLNPSRYINVSAFKFGGKQIYFSDMNSASNVMRGRVAAICLTKSKEPIDVPVSIADKKVLEYCYNGRYQYIVVPFASESDAQAFLAAQNVKASFPDAQIEVFQDGIPQ
ncbi:MAG: MlaD family protein [Bacteroidales bacterium]|nr:MlaD family protein [Bacteroidales bacterium]